MPTPPEPTVEDYMARLAAQLKSLPAAAREEHLRELRLHVEQLVAARAGQPDAVSAALYSFGSPTKIGWRLTWEFLRGAHLPDPERAAVVTAATCHCAFFTLVCLTPLGGDMGSDFLRAMLSAALIAGAVTGCACPRYAVRGTALGLLGLSIIFAGAPILCVLAALSSKVGQDNAQTVGSMLTIFLTQVAFL